MQSPALTAALWMTGAIVSFSVMAVGGRELSSALDTFEIMLYRSLVGVFIVVGLGLATRSMGQITRRHMGLHFGRNLVHFAGQNLWFYAITVIPLAQVFALEFTTPIWVLLLSPLLLGERLTKVGILAAAMGFAGILIVARPDPAALNAGVVTAALSAVCFALGAIATRRLTRTETTLCILFYLTLMQTGFGIVTAGYDGDVALPTLETATWLLWISVAGLFAHYCLTKALAVAPANLVMPMDFARLPVIAVVGMLLYDEPLDALVFVGAALIFAGNWLNLTRGQAPAPTSLRP